MYLWPNQVNLVVISEIYRELTLNQRFHQYATGAGFQIRACEGYDPESKGKVESGVKYVKQNALYGESFDSWQALEQYLVDWLKDVANKRLHGIIRSSSAKWAEILAWISPKVCLTSAISCRFSSSAYITLIISIKVWCS